MGLIPYSVAFDKDNPSAVTLTQRHDKPRPRLKKKDKVVHLIIQDAADKRNLDLGFIVNAAKVILYKDSPDGEMADTSALKAEGEIREGSTPSLGTKEN